MNKLFIFVFLALIATAFAVNNVKIQPEQPKNEGFLPLCMICSYVVDKVDDYLQAHTNTTQIVSMVEHDCQELQKSDWINKCDNIVSEYLGEIITLLEEKKSAEIVCKVITLC
ncbi:hypothetical protein DICPUDRAFT_38709 [Dictyostelium purpureum]|uniref:Saposin B-type domain-containing protein n=1 Tax=Dictyostelium purpureum TaxID=5786 RepID=F0ZV34_DICPU|nr:uncharacterized protein DICPUDRAFT_38709 [Dictyostelium purpureum]EGC32206.1 hypothetical protein DICPUDRAFT_38709 [Dictyostelium purpureum]|eukprot:XP_003291278.1 hypothetical protein DICPUDRAFT_38709 [Dictyostelium purpureum]